MSVDDSKEHLYRDEHGKKEYSFCGDRHIIAIYTFDAGSRRKSQPLLHRWASRLSSPDGVGWRVSGFVRLLVSRNLLRPHGCAYAGKRLQRSIAPQYGPACSVASRPCPTRVLLSRLPHLQRNRCPRDRADHSAVSVSWLSFIGPSPSVSVEWAQAIRLRS